MTDDQRALVLEHEHVVGQVAGPMVRRMRRCTIEYGDVFQAGRVGLCEAALRWTPDRGVPFGAFARLRIHGAIVDALRESLPVSGMRRRPWAGLGVVQLSALQEDVGFDVPAPPASIETRLDGRLATQLVRELEPRERLVLLAWACGVGETRIGQEIGRSPSRVNQLRNGALRRLRKVLVRDLAGGTEGGSQRKCA